MAHIPRLISKKLSRFVSAEKIFQSSSPVFLPFYHVVSSKTFPHILNYPYFNEKQFEQQLDFFLKYFEPVSLEYIFKTTPSRKKVFHLSFDDGLRSCAEVVAPILLKKGIPATFFINSGFVDNKELFHRYKASLILAEMYRHPDTEAENLLLQNNLTKTNLLKANFSQRAILDEAAEFLELDFRSFLDKEKPYLSTSQINWLSQSGFTIGGHSHKHPEFWRISEKKQIKHVRRSMKWIADNVPQKIRAFSFPFTDDGVSSHFFKRLKEKNICDITFGTAGLKYDSIKTHFQRYPMEQSGNFETNLKAEFVYLKLREAIGKERVKH